MNKKRITKTITLLLCTAVVSGSLITTTATTEAAQKTQNPSAASAADRKASAAVGKKTDSVSDLEKATKKAKKKAAKKKVPVSVKIGKTTYYFTKKAKLRATKKGSSYYYKNGKKMSKADRKDFTTLLAAEKVVAKITKPSMSNKKKLRKCFHWVMKKYYGTHRKFSMTDYWPATYAMDHFRNKDGDCRSDGAAFAYLAAACGYKKVYVCLDSSGKDNHGWAQVNGKVYDPLFAQSKSFSRNYAASYRTYGLSAIVKVPIPYASTESRKASKKRYTNPYTKSGKKKKLSKKKKSSKKKKNVKKISYKIRKWDKKKKHLLYKDGRTVTGIVLYKNRFYAFDKKGNLDKDLTAALRAAAKEKEEAASLLALTGKPVSRSYSDSCFGDGEDGLFTYRTFRITTFKPADGTPEIIMSIE